MESIGAGALEFFDTFVKQDNHKKYDYRSISGVISLQKKYDDEVINNACIRAVSYGALSYKVVKKICDSNVLNLPVETNETYINSDTTNVSRELSEYNKLINLGELKNE